MIVTFPISAAFLFTITIHNHNWLLRFSSLFI